MIEKDNMRLRGSGINYLIENYYENIKPELNLVCSYLEDKSLKDIFIKCRLKPYKYNSRFNIKLLLRRHWVDEFGNSLILEKKKIKIIENDMSLDPKHIKYTDLYEGVGIENVSKISKLFYLYYGKDEDTNEDYYMFAFLGIDNYIRVFVFYQCKWYNFSPLSLGIKNLRKITENEDVKVFAKINGKDVVIFPCEKQEEWIISLPVHDSFWKQTTLTKEKLYFLGE